MFDFIKNMFKKKEKPIEEKQQAVLPSVSTDPKEAQTVLKKAREAEMQMEVQDIIALTPKDKQAPPAEVEEKPEEQAQDRRRQYLRKSQEAQQLKKGADDAMVQDVLVQLKSSGKDEKKEVKKAPAEEKSLKPLSMNDLFPEAEKGGEEKKSDAEPPSSPLFKQLDDMSKERKDVSFVDIPREPGMACPNCRSTNSRVVFCPYCGSGMCANCTPSIKTYADSFKYTCPHCGEEVTVRKKSP